MTAAVAWGPLGWPYRLLTCIYVTGAAAGYWWLRTHDAVRAARQRRDDLAAAIADRRLWHQILPRIGLAGWHVQWRRDTNLGEERLITTSPENALATRTAASASGIAEKLAHILGLPYGRIEFTTTDYPGELIIGIRTVDLSVRDAAYHPMTTPWPDAQPSPFADWFAETASIRDPVIWGFCPEDGSALTMELFSAIGGRAVGVIGMTGSGKSNLLNGARENVTRCTDARMVQLNGAHMGDELIWEPLSALTLCGPVRTDEEVRDKIAAALAALCLLVTNRSATLAETGHSTFQPTPDDPAVEIIIDEVDEIVALRARRGQGPGLPRLQAAQIRGRPAAGHPAGRHRGARRRHGPRQHERGTGRQGRAGHRIPARQRGGKGNPRHPRVRQRRPRLLPAMGPALGHRRPGGAGRSCSASPPTNSPT